MAAVRDFLPVEAMGYFVRGALIGTPGTALARPVLLLPDWAAVSVLAAWMSIVERA